MTTRSYLVGIAALLLLTQACDSERHRLMRDEYPSYPTDIRYAIDHGHVFRGMTRNQVYLSLGNPVCRKEDYRGDTQVEVWLYPPMGRDPCVTANFRVYFEGNSVVTWDHFTTPSRWTDPKDGVPP